MYDRLLRHNKVGEWKIFEIGKLQAVFFSIFTRFCAGLHLVVLLEQPFYLIIKDALMVIFVSTPSKFL